ncbi:MAG: tetratricopeptide repeat protein [Bryobacteraceae bacterium]
MRLVRSLRLLLSIVPLWAGASADLEQARKLYSRTEYRDSVKLLQDMPDKNGAVLELLGQDYYMLGDYKKATDTLERALAADPRNSDYALWLGRAYGRRAETSSPLTAPGNASKARQYFEKAVQLNPRNTEAMSDLLEFYLDAPGFLGGGLDKASAMAAQIAAADAAEGHSAQARLAEKKKDFSAAEQHYKKSAELAPQQVGRLIDVAKFLAVQGRYAESDEVFQRAAKIAPDSPKLMYARAEVYVKERRNLDSARQLLRSYLQSSLTPDDPPRADAEKLLKKASGG